MIAICCDPDLISYEGRGASPSVPRDKRWIVVFLSHPDGAGRKEENVVV
jgi:hypothetical protein